MSNWNDELNMSHPFATYFLFRNLNTTTVADNAFITNTFVFTAMAFIVFYRTEYTFTKQTVTLRLVCTIVDGFKTSPLEFSKISSGDANPIEIFEKLLFILLSFLKAIN